MTPEEKFVFDLQGYIVIKNVLTDAELAELNEVADSKFPYADPDSVRREDIISTWSPVVHQADRPPERSSRTSSSSSSPSSGSTTTTASS